MKEFYRYEAITYAVMGGDGDYKAPTIPDPVIRLNTFYLVKETTKGYWINYSFGSLNGKPVWVSKTSKKRYAYPTKSEALNNFIKRTERRVSILQAHLNTCQAALYKAGKLIV